MRGNYNYDKGAEYVFGFTDQFDVECWEFKNNTSDACNFLGPVPEIWVDDFEARYPEESTAIERFKEMHDWVVSTKDNLDKFKMEFEDHFDMHFSLIYYVYTFFALMVDQRAKNMFLTYWGETGKWSPWFYDNDTSFGINNEGQLVFDYFHSDTDQLEGANVYNGQNSVLWCNFRDAFPDEIKATYQDLRSNGVLNYDELIEQFITKGSDKWSESIYNEDADFKYISMLYEDGDASNLSQVRGTGEEHFRYFVENRLNYCDGKWYAPAYADDYVALRIYTPETWAGVEPNADITVTPFSHMYAGVRYKANGTLYQKRVSANEVTTFEAPDETFNDTETAIYGASQLSSLGDLSPLYCGTINVSKATKLTELIIGSDVEGYSNPNLLDLSVGTNNLLKVLNVRNCPNLTDPLALAGCPNIEEIYAAGSGITGVELANSGYLKTIELPATITNLTLKNQLYIESLTLEGYGVIKTINIENCPTVRSLDILGAATNAERVRLTNVNWTYDTAAEVLALADRNLAGIDENGANIDKMWIDGKCHIKTLTGADYLKVKEAFPYMTITYDNLTAVLTYMSEDGSTKLHEETIVNGGDGTYAETNFIKDSTAQYDFTFGGWSLVPNGTPNENALKNVEADRTVYVAFTQSLRKYTVKFYNGTTLLETKTVEYGSDATYTGATPVHPTAPDDCEFRAWKPEPTNIQGDTNCYAQWYDRREITDDWATIAAAVADGTATEKYAIGAFKTLNIGEVKLPFDFDYSSAVVYNDEIHIFGGNSTYDRKHHYKWNGIEWVSVSTLPYNFHYSSAIVYNEEIHIIGGGNNSSEYKNHFKWNGVEWTSVSTLPFECNNSPAVVYNNEIHILGTKTYTAHYKWDGSDWVEVSTLPFIVNRSSAVVCNDEIHIMGGFTNDSTAQQQHYKWNGIEWTSVSTIPYYLYDGSAVVLNEEIHVLGSTSSKKNQHYKWNGTEWVSVSTLPYEFYYGSAVIHNGEINILGGLADPTNHYSYSSETSKWIPFGTTESIPMEVIAHNHDELADGVGKWEGIAKPTNIPQYGCAVTYQNEVHALGGNSDSSYTQHIKWDNTNSTWVTVSTLPYQFRSGCAVILNDEIHILGSYKTTNKTEHYKWNATDGWVSVSTLPYSFCCSSAVVLNNEIHILGSYDSSSRKYHYKWNGTEWASVSTLPYKFYYGSAVVYNGEIHIFSGSGTSGNTGHYKWDDSAWTSVSTLPYNLQYGVATIINNEIHIFGGAGNETGHYKWDGTEWTSMSTLPGSFSNYPLAVCNGTPYIFISTSCYKLTGASWKERITGVVGYQGSMVVYKNDLYSITGQFANEFKKWNGDSWTKLDNAPMYATKAVVYNDEIHIFNGTSHAKWDGTAWITGVSVLPTSLVGDDGRCGIVVVYDGKIHIINNTIHRAWDGSEWSQISTLPYTPVHGRGIVYNNEIHVMSTNDWDGGYEHYKWNGVEWTKASTLPYRCYNCSTAVFNNELHIFGGTQNRRAHYKWDGIEWSKVSKLPFDLSDTYREMAIVYRGKMYIKTSNSHLFCYENPTATLTFFAKNLTAQKVSMDSSLNANNTSGGWKYSKGRTYLNETLYTLFNSELKNAIKPVVKLSDGGYNDLTYKTTEDYLWLLSSGEAGHTASDALPGLGTAYPVFTSVYTVVRKRVGEDSWTDYSFRNVKSSVNYQYYGVNSYAHFTGINKKTAYSIGFGFCI